jgi:hypothetical protein
MSRRIRFGLIFVGPSPATDGGFLRDLGIRQIEGCSLRNKHYVLFTVERPKRSSDILEAVGAQNRVSSRGESTELEEELMMASDGVLMDGASTIVLMPVDSGDSSGGVSVAKSSSSAPGGSRHSLVAVFDKGHAFQSHEIFRMICAAKLSHMQVSAPPALGDRETIQPSSYWSWSAPGVLDPSSGKKRVVSELSSDLVETSIKPSSSKRVSLSSSPVPPPPPPPKEVASDIEGEVFGVSGGSSGIDIVAEAAGGDDTAGLPSAPPPVDVMGDDAFEAQVGYWICVELLLCVSLTCQRLMVGWEHVDLGGPSADDGCCSRDEESVIVLPSPDCPFHWWRWLASSGCWGWVAVQGEWRQCSVDGCFS